MLPESFQNILWEYDLSKTNLSDATTIERVFSIGNLDQTRMLLKKVPIKKIKKVVISHRKNFDRLTQQYLKAIFSLDLTIHKKDDDESRTKNIPTRSIVT